MAQLERRAVACSALTPRNALLGASVSTTISISRLRRRAWLAPLVIGLPGIAAYFTLSPEVANVAYEAFGLAAVVAVFAGIRLHGPHHRGLWQLVAIGFAFWLAGDVVTTLLAPDGGDVPLPSWADAGYLTGYVALIVGVGLLAGPILRGSQLERPALLDAGIIAVTAVFPVWMFVVGPLLRAPEATLSEALTTAAYPMLDVLLIAVIARHLLIEGRKPPAGVLLALGLGSYLAADLANVGESLLGTYSADALVNAGWLLGYVLAASAVLHPSMARIGPHAEELRRMSLVRRVTLLSAAVVPAGVIWLHNGVDDGDRAVLALGAAALIGLVLARLFAAVRDAQQLRGQVVWEARHDPLTGLPNRKYFGERFEAALASPSGVGLVFLDLNGFKLVNDEMGHEAGDEVLAEVARRLVQTVRDRDDVARLGGDEFAIIVGHARAPAAVAAVAGRVEAALAPSASIAGRRVPIRASIGTAWAGGPTTARDLLRQADTAMYAMKLQSRSVDGSTPAVRLA